MILGLLLSYFFFPLLWSRPIQSTITENELNLQNAYNTFLRGIRFPRNTTHDPIGYWYSKFYRRINPNFGIFDDINNQVFDADKILKDFNFTIEK